MATRNFGPLRRLIESRMFDACTITRDPQGTDDDTLDQTTGALTPPGSDVSTVYAGKCVLYPYSERSGRVNPEGGRAYTEKVYTARIPWNSAQPKPGDVLTVTASANDAVLVGRPLRVMEVEISSVLTSRDLVVQDRSAT